jgi:aldose sugar dehydrogenase
MKRPLSYLCLVALFVFNTHGMIIRAQVIDSTSILFTIDTVAKNLGYPWEITYGPDDSLWITEARGYRVLRISAARTQADMNHPPQQILKIPLASGEINFGRTIGTWPQGGMQGLAIHPQFYSGKPWVYLAYVFKTTGTPCPSSPGSPCYFRTKIVRCHFYFAGDAGSPAPAKDTLTIMDTVISNLPGSNDHNSGRMVISPQPEADGTYKLYYTIGDMGAGQFNNASRTNNAQSRDTCEGKILRFNTEPDGDGVPGSPIHDYDKWRQWIPNDNPFTHSTIGGGTMETPVYSFGHRNAQGIIWGNANGTWRLYSSEHGDKSDDEINDIIAGANYGWPKVAGLGSDNNYSSLDAYPNNDNLASQPINYAENTWATSNNMQRPLFVTFNWAASAVPADGSNIFTWGTIAPSSIDFYKGNIPGWKNSLLVTSLKYGMYRLKLKAAGDYVDSSSSSNTVDTFPLLHGWRVRDVAIDPVANSGRFWVVIDSTGSTSGPTGGFSGSSNPTRDGGKVLRLTYKTLITLPINNNPLNRPPLVKDLIQIFPNPVQNIVNIHGKKELRKPLLIQICDIYGRVLKEETSFRNDFSVDVSYLRPGTYLLKLFNGYDMEVQIEKFIKE